MAAPKVCDSSVDIVNRAVARGVSWYVGVSWIESYIRF